MRHQDLTKGQIYNNILDKDIPLMFTGKKTTRNQMNHFDTIAHFTPVRTEKNKNWFDSIKEYHKAFDNDNGNSYITE
jgi:hypothetical protein